MKYLVVNNDIVFNKGKNYLFVDKLLADKSLMYYRNIRFCVSENPWMDKERYQEAHDYVAQLKKKFLLAFVTQLNEKYELEFDFNQWNLLIGTWLTDIIFLLYDHYTRITSIEEEFKLIMKDFTINTRKTLIDSLVSMVRDDDFNAYLYYCICKELGVEVVYDNQNDYILKLKKILYYLQSSAGRKMLVTKLLKNKTLKNENGIDLFVDKVKDNTETVVVKGRFPGDLEKDIKEEVEERIVMFTDVEFEKIEKKILSSIEDDSTVTIILDGMEYDNKFEEIVGKIVPELIPIEFNLVAFRKYYECAKIITKNWNIKKIYSSAYIGVGVLASMCACLEYERNVEIVDIQHSATYNLDNSVIYAEALLFNKILTWGWKATNNEYNCNINNFHISRTVPAIRMPYDYDSTRILYASNGIEYYECGRGYICDNYVTRHFQLIDAMNEFEKKQIVVRLFVDDISNPIVHKYICSYKNIKLENVLERKFVDSLLCSKILICDSYGSTHIESMILNHPVIFFNGIDMPIKNEQVEYLLEDLKKVYIYADSPEELLSNYRKIENIEQWWNSDAVQTTVRRYLDVCANGYNKDLKRIWIDEFEV